jgi:hypothetical protein
LYWPWHISATMTSFPSRTATAQGQVDIPLQCHFFICTCTSKRNSIVRSSVGCILHTCSRFVAMLFQQLELSTGCVRTACSQLVDKLPTAHWQLTTRLLSSTDLLKLFQQLVIALQFNNLSTSCEWQPCSNLIK